MRPSLQKKVDFAIGLIQSASKVAADNGCPAIEVCYSGGKDSDVILELTKMSGVPYRAIYKNTTIDPSGTIKHALDNGCEMLRPKKRFFELVEKNGMPNMFRRHCCRFLKEYKVLPYAIVGIRREESVKRAARYNEPEMCRVYKSGGKARQYFPILEWTSQDVYDFVRERGIKCHNLYYDERGEFHPERRLGCMCCPMTDKTRIEQFKSYPNMVKAYVRAAQKYIDTHPSSVPASEYGDAYTWFVRDVFYRRLSKEKWEEMQKNKILPPQITRNFYRIIFILSLTIKQERF